MIADSPKGKNADEVVVVGAHLDSVIEGPGINDNGSGSADDPGDRRGDGQAQVHQEAAAEGALRLLGGGGGNLLGSQYYVDNLTDDAAREHLREPELRHAGFAQLRPVRVRRGRLGHPDRPVPPGSAQIEKIFTDYFASQGLASEPTAFNGRSDYGPFIAVGIPAGGLFSGAEGFKTPEEAAIYGGTAGAAYDGCYHQACDDINNLNTKALSEMGDAAAHAVWTLAKSKSGIQVDGSRVAQKAAKKVTLKQKGHALTRSSPPTDLSDSQRAIAG